MNWMLILLLGIILMLVIVVLRLVQRTSASGMQDLVKNIQTSFGSAAFDALSKATEEFSKLAKSGREVDIKELGEKKSLIDQQLQRMTSEMEKVSTLMKELEKDRIEKFGELTTQLKTTSEQTAALMQTTSMLKEALASEKARGQWGERMAEDVLRLAGFIENVNYLKQKAIEGVGSRPDFTFLLPQGLKLNMDVKFPLDNYVRFLEAKGDVEKEKFRSEFLKDVRARIKEITTREYINPEQNTVNCVLLFIPNEQIYGFIHEQDSTILDESIRTRVIICSPITLFAVLAIVRQGIDNFRLEKKSSEILSLMDAFRKQWLEFMEKFDKLGERIEQAHKEYESLVTTRRRQLEKPLSKIDELMMERGLTMARKKEEAIDVEASPKNE